MKMRLLFADALDMYLYGPHPRYRAMYNYKPQNEDEVAFCCCSRYVSLWSPCRYRAMYNYKPQNEDEVELAEGDIVFVMEKCDDGWFVGTSQRTGIFGTFPGNYVTQI
jgi:hypothetical protein